MSATYRYTAREGSGALARGSIVATTRSQALARLRERRLTPLSIEEGIGSSDLRLDDRGAADLSRTVSQLLDAGLPVAQALSFASDELRGGAGAVAMRLREAAERGEPLSGALASVAGSPARLLSGVLAAGETSGDLSAALGFAAVTFGRNAETRSRIIASLIYPAFVVTATGATLAAFVLFVVPTLAGAFHGAEDQLPGSTRWLLAFSEAVKAHGPTALMACVAVGGALWITPATRLGVARMLDWALSSPAGLGIAPRLDFGALAELSALSISAGVPGSAAFDAAALGLRSQALSDRVRDVVAAIRVGERPSEAFARLAHPPATFVRLMQVGEETGNLGPALEHAARLLNAEAEQRLQRLGAIAGPAITLALGGIVAGVVLSLFLGLLAMSDLAAQ